MSDTGTYKRIITGGSGEIEEKKSRFIATISAVASEEEAAEFIKSIKKKYYDARHNCYAYIVGENGEIKRSSDDGEPGGSAGRPMLDIIEGENIRNVCVVVTRYFGGTLLGVGGLIRAYQGAVKEGLAACEVREMKPLLRVRAVISYADVNKVKQLSERMGIIENGSTYGQEVELILLVKPEDAETFTAEMAELSGGTAVVETIEKGFF